jgi:hypothetical protein
MPQSTQLSAPTPPLLLALVPKGQISHVVELEFTAALPGSHKAQASAFASLEYFPGSHSMQ